MTRSPRVSFLLMSVTVVAAAAVLRRGQLRWGATHTEISTLLAGDEVVPAPDLTATSRLWQRWGDPGFVKFLTTGLAPNGRPAGPPMPAFKMTQADAEAVVEFLKSLK